MLFRHRDIVLEDPRGGERFGLLSHRVTYDRVQRIAARHRLLHEMPTLERCNRVVDPGRLDVGEPRERRQVDVVALDRGEHAEHAPALYWQAWPGPRDQQCNLR